MFVLFSQEILYDRAKRSGLLYEKVRYKSRKRQDKKQNTPTVHQNTTNSIDNRSIEELISFFDSCVLSRDKNEILNRMESSAQLRLASNQNNREIFDKCFHLYRLDAELVRFI